MDNKDTLATLGTQNTGQKTKQQQTHTQHRNIERLTERTHQTMGVNLGAAEGEAVYVSYKICTVLLVYTKYIQ